MSSTVNEEKVTRGASPEAGETGSVWATSANLDDPAEHAQYIKEWLKECKKYKPSGRENLSRAREVREEDFLKPGPVKIDPLPEGVTLTPLFQCDEACELRRVEQVKKYFAERGY